MIEQNSNQQNIGQQPTEAYETPSNQDQLKKHIVDFLFEVSRLGYRKQETISELSYETSFTESVKMARGQTWKYMPDKVKLIIKKAYEALADDIKKVDERTDLSDKNKTLEKTSRSYETALSVLEIIFHCMNNSPLSVEFKEVEVKDYKTLIEAIRTKKKIDIFSDVEEDEHAQ